MLNSLFSKELVHGSYHFIPYFYSTRLCDNIKICENHMHERYEFMYCHSGTVAIYFGDELQILKSSNAIIIDRNIPHRVDATNRKSRLLCLEFTIKSSRGCFPSIKEICADSIALHNFFDRKFEYKIYNNIEEIYPIFKSIISELDGNQNYFNFQLLITQMFLTFANFDQTFEGLSGSEINNVKYIRKIKEYISLHYDENLRLEVIASVVNLNPSYMLRLFKKHENQTIGHYISNIRMKKAAILVLDGNYTIKQICKLVGIKSTQQFYKSFLNIFKMTPREYKSNIANTISDTSLI